MTTTSSSFPVSLEFFPGRTAEGSEKIRAVRNELYVLKPDFCSVTYGAGGSTQEGTFGAITEMLAEGMESAAPHFACVGATKASVREQLAT
jgi:methylenetetrahydrofolate reductase (NADPH)